MSTVGDMVEGGGEVLLVFDTDLRQPACAILQAAMGGDHGITHLFNEASWLLAPTPGMKLFRVDRATLQKVAGAVNERFPRVAP